MRSKFSQSHTTHVGTATVLRWPTGTSATCVPTSKPLSPFVCVLLCCFNKRERWLMDNSATFVHTSNTLFRSPPPFDTHTRGADSKIVSHQQLFAMSRTSANTYQYKLTLGTATRRGSATLLTSWGSPCTTRTLYYHIVLFYCILLYFMLRHFMLCCVYT
jgi:hypothetical protein